MTTKDTSLPAFPTTEAHGVNYGSPGLTKREYFAGLAMQGLLACGALTMAQDNRIRPFNEQEISDLAFHMADAMLAEGSKQ